MITMRARTIIVWLGSLLLLAPIAFFLLEDISVLFDNIEFVAVALLILSLVVTGWRLKKRLKERMERGLGRSVQDEELTSIAAWMKIPDQAARAGRESEDFDFDN